MRKRLLIVAGLIALAGVIVLLAPPPCTVSARFVRIAKFPTGEFALIDLTNHTTRLCSITAWSEYPLGSNAGIQSTPYTTRLNLRAHTNEVIGVLLPRGGKHRVTMNYSVAVDDSLLRYWYLHLRTLLGIKPFAGNRLHLELE